jgi:hypothetical protein
MAHSKSARAKAKPAKPHRDFPLFPHATRRWAKKIRQKLHYFGPVTPEGDCGAQAALERWLREKDDLLAGRTPRVTATDPRADPDLTVTASHGPRLQCPEHFVGPVHGNLVGHHSSPLNALSRIEGSRASSSAADWACNALRESTLACKSSRQATMRRCSAGGGHGTRNDSTWP